MFIVFQTKIFVFVGKVKLNVIQSGMTFHNFHTMRGAKKFIR